jgi:hypothetical protein
MSEERGFEVVDKRRVKADAAAEAPEPAAEAPEATETEDRETVAEAVQAGSHTEPEADAVADTGFESEEDETEGLEESEAAAAGGFPGGLPEMSVAGIIAMSVGLLSEIAWVKMGLVPNPMSGRIERDLGEAKRAIDAVSDLAKHVEALANDADRREFQVMLSNLRLNFVQQSNRRD